MESQCIAKKAYFDSAPLNLHWEKLAWFHDHDLGHEVIISTTLYYM